MPTEMEKKIALKIDAAHELGSLYDFGISVDVDHDRAQYYYKIVACLDKDFFFLEFFFVIF